MILKSLITKIIVSTSLILFVAIGISWLIHMRIYERQLMDEIRERVKTVLDTAENSISKSMRIGKTDDTQNILELVNSHMKENSTVRIFHPDGIIIKSTDLKETGKRINRRVFEIFNEGKNEIIALDSKGEHILSMTRPIKNIRECHMCHGESSSSIGVLNVEISLQSTDNKLAEARKLSNISALIISLILSVSIFLLLYWIVIKPISKLSRKMSLTEKGDLTVRSDLSKSDEVGQLGRSFDSMIDKLQTARMELESFHFQQMERADRLASVGELASGIAHEIKNPLAGIAGAVQILSKEFKGDKQKQKIVNEILQQISRLDKSVKDLLNYASPSMPSFELGDINSIIDKSLFFVTQQPKAREIEIIKNLDRTLPKIRVDYKQIQQVLLNLILNAMNALEGKGKVRISTYLSGKGQIVVEVVDNGKGIAEEEMSKLFIPFFTTREEGTGLGLSISKRIIEQHNGKIEISSRVDEGTTVKIFLPAERAKKKG